MLQRQEAKHFYFANQYFFFFNCCMGNDGGLICSLPNCVFMEMDGSALLDNVQRGMAGQFAVFM
jgi:hypothetical protein